EGVGITGHRIAQAAWSTADLVLRDPFSAVLFSFPVCAPSLVLTQLATELDHVDLVAVGDALVTELPRPGLRDGPVLATREDLSRVVAESTGRRGVKRLRSAIRDVRRGSLSRPESLLRQLIVHAGLPEPQLNYPVRDREKREVAKGDLCWPEFAVVLEYEGDGHRTDRYTFRS